MQSENPFIHNTATAYWSVIKSRVHKFKVELSRVFDDNLHTKQWHNYFDYVIMGLILLSTLEVFLSTFVSIEERYGTYLQFIDHFTTYFFTVEVSLRIWCADMIDAKYKGFWGRVRYCLSFYGLIDLLATYPFYLHLALPIPQAAFKALRVARLLRMLRIFRYMKAVTVLSRAIQAKKQEFYVSLQFLINITLLLSFILFFVEHEAQPEVYSNGWKSVIWAFAQYIGDPGGFANTPPITLTGRLIASFIGVLGIAIFAVPAGLIGSAFSEVMEKDDRKEKAKNWANRLHLAFERKSDRPSGFQIVPRYISRMELMARMGLKEDEILDGVASDNHFRMINLAATHPVEDEADDKLAVEHFTLNTCYGQCIDRHSPVTIFSPSNIEDPVIGWWAYYVAKIGGFNYISRELGETRPYHSFYLYKADGTPGREECMADINRLVNSKNKWLFTLMAASGSSEPTYPTQLHFTYGGKQGNENYDDPNITLNDVATFDTLYRDFEKMLAEKYQLSADCQRYHNNASPHFFARHLKNKVNAVCLRVAWSVIERDTRAILIAQELALTINRHINNTDNPDIPELKIKDIGYDGYNQ